MDDLDPLRAPYSPRTLGYKNVTTRTTLGEGGDLTSCNERRKPANLRTLLAEYERGERTPSRIELPELPPDATKDMVAVAESFAFCAGLSASTGSREPMAYSVRFAAEQVGWPGQTGANRAHAAIKALLAADVISLYGEMDPKGGRPRGTYVYVVPEPVGDDLAEAHLAEVSEPALLAGALDEVPPVREAEADPVEGGAILVEVSDEEPVPEVPDEAVLPFEHVVWLPGHFLSDLIGPSGGFLVAEDEPPRRETTLGTTSCVRSR